MRGTEDAEERGAEGAEGSLERVDGVWEGLFCKIHAEFAPFEAFCEDTNLSSKQI